MDPLPQLPSAKDSLNKVINQLLDLTINSKTGFADESLVNPTLPTIPAHVPPSSLFANPIGRVVNVFCDKTAITDVLYNMPVGIVQLDESARNFASVIITCNKAFELSVMVVYTMFVGEKNIHSTTAGPYKLDFSGARLVWCSAPSIQTANPCVFLVFSDAGIVRLRIPPNPDKPVSAETVARQSITEPSRLVYASFALEKHIVLVNVDPDNKKYYLVYTEDPGAVVSRVDSEHLSPDGAQIQCAELYVHEAGLAVAVVFSDASVAILECPSLKPIINFSMKASPMIRANKQLLTDTPLPDAASSEPIMRLKVAFGGLPIAMGLHSAYFCTPLGGGSDGNELLFNSMLGSKKRVLAACSSPQCYAFYLSDDSIMVCSLDGVMRMRVPQCITDNHVQHLRLMQDQINSKFGRQNRLNCDCAACILPVLRPCGGIDLQCVQVGETKQYLLLLDKYSRTIIIE